MNLWNLVEGIMYGRRNTKCLGTIVRFPLFLLSLIYRLVVQTRCRLYEKRIFRTKELPCGVISVGNISLGGSGKTPTTHYMANLFQERGFHVAVLSRGYKGKAKDKINLVSDGRTIFLNPRESGDEPYMLARKLNDVPVLTSTDRFKIGKYASEQFGSSILILDDGFQHIQLKRDLDILLIDSHAASGKNHLFPRGTLREPLKNMKRVDLFIVAGEEDQKRQRDLGDTIRGIKGDANIFYGRFQAKHLTDPSGENIGLDRLKGKRVLAFSGIAHPENFRATLNELGATVVKELVYPDHHWYLSGDYTTIRNVSKDVDVAVTTEKDLIKLDASFVREIGVFTLDIELQLNREEVFTEFLLERFNKA